MFLHEFLDLKKRCLVAPLSKQTLDAIHGSEIAPIALRKVLFNHREAHLLLELTTLGDFFSRRLRHLTLDLTID
jgi:hypothetical protein